MTIIHGEVAPGFENIREVFEQSFEEGGEIGASFSVARDGEFLVDLWGGYADRARTKPWERDTLPNVWSTTKGMASLCCALLVDRGLMSYTDKITKIWPEFGVHGKDQLTIGQVLSHQAGLCGFVEETPVNDLYDQNLVADRLANQKPIWEPGSRSGYHAITHGFLAAEIAKRVTEKTIGAFFQDEIGDPWEIDFYIGLPEEEEHRIAEMIEAPNAEALAGEDQNSSQKLAFGNPAPSPLLPNERAWRAAEIPAAGGRGSACALAKIYDVLANGGAQNNRRLISEDAIAKMTATQIQNEDAVLGFEMRWGAGFMGNPQGLLYGPNEESYGHAGWGGSYGMADPKTGIGVGYTMNQMAAEIAGSSRGMALHGATYAALS